jgi:hypothetical protein
MIKLLLFIYLWELQGKLNELKKKLKKLKKKTRFFLVAVGGRDSFR